MSTAPSRLAVALALAAVYVLWGSTYYAIVLALPAYPPFLLTAVRMLIAGGLMWVVLRARGAAWPTPPQWRNLAVLAVLLTVIANAFVNLAEQTVSSGLVSIGVAAMPIWAGLFSALRGQQPSRGEWMGLLLGFAGIVWLNAGTQINGSLGGALAVLLAPIAWSGGSMWSRGRDLPPPFVSAAWQMILGSIGAAIVGLVLGERLAWPPPMAPTLAMFYLVLAGSIFGFTAYIWLLHHVRPALATSYAYVNPPIAVLIGVLLGGETINAHGIGAMAVILSAVVLITLSKARAAAVPRSVAVEEPA
ncbi:MAG: drug/metabolite exporter YedA [Arenimonas sp.]